MHWDVPVELSAVEKRIAARMHRVGRFYLFLREVQRELFAPEFEAELEQAYGKARGTAPLPAAMLATVTLLQTYDQVSDAEAVETALMDRRWQLVLGCLGVEEPPFSQGVVSQFRQRMIAHDLELMADAPRRYEQRRAARQRPNTAPRRTGSRTRGRPSP